MRNQSQNQSNNPNFPSALMELVDIDNLDLDNLKDVLQQESEALKSRDHENLNRLSTQKSTLVKQIEQRAKQKASLIAKSGLKISPGKVQEGLNKLNNPALSNKWESNIDKLSVCKALNEKNGLVLSHTLKRTEKLMSIVRGQANKPNLYGNKGYTKPVNNGGYIIGKA